MEKKTRHLHAGLHKSKAKLASTLNKKAEAPEANANGTSGYLIM